MNPIIQALLVEPWRTRYAKPGPRCEPTVSVHRQSFGDMLYEATGGEDNLETDLGRVLCLETGAALTDDHFALALWASNADLEARGSAALRPSRMPEGDFVAIDSGSVGAAIALHFSEAPSVPVGPDRAITCPGGVAILDAVNRLLCWLPDPPSAWDLAGTTAGGSIAAAAAFLSAPSTTA